MREIGYYWVYGNKCFTHYENWYISYWNGNFFWIDGDDFNEDVFQKIDERKIIKLNWLIIYHKSFSGFKLISFHWLIFNIGLLFNPHCFFSSGDY